MKRHLLYKLWLRLAKLTIVGVLLTSCFTLDSHATVVQTTNRIINNGSADFGSGNHAFGGPQSNGTITYDWSTVGTQIRSTGRVRGTLYWDSAVSSGCARLTIRFRRSDDVNLAVRTIDECGPGGDANNSLNKTSVDESFGSIDLSYIVLTTAVLQNGSPVNTSPFVTITQVSIKSFNVLVENGRADFGGSNFGMDSHHFGRPDRPGRINFQRNSDGTVSGGVVGVLFYDAPNASSCAQMEIAYRSSSGTILDSPPDFLNCGPGGNANSGANQLFINDAFSSGSLFDIRIIVEDTAAPTEADLRVFGFAGQVGDFEVDPVNALAEVNEQMNYGLIWSVPEPLNWHDLNTLELRITDGAEAIIHVRFEENGNLISLFNEATGRFGKAYRVGSHREFQTRFASLSLADTAVAPVNGALGEGPNSPTIRLGLGLRFKPPAAGRTYSVEVAATDDFGHSDPFAVAGTLRVTE